MKFPWNRYVELTLERRNTLQVFITNKCNLHCQGCFARKAMAKPGSFIDLDEYYDVVTDFVKKDGQQINILGGEPFLHPQLDEIISINKANGLKTTIYTNGYFLDKQVDAKLRVSIHSFNRGGKNAMALTKLAQKFDANFMISKSTTLDDLLDSASLMEYHHGCRVFFISSIRELDNPRKEFFDDTDITMPVIQYKELVHQFLSAYHGRMDIHVSKRGVFESTITLPDTRCRFANYFIGGKIIQCPYDVVNLKYQDDYKFGVRPCQQNNTCLMSKVVYRPVKGG